MDSKSRIGVAATFYGDSKLPSKPEFTGSPRQVDEWLRNFKRLSPQADVAMRFWHKGKVLDNTFNTFQRIQEIANSQAFEKYERQLRRRRM